MPNPVITKVTPVATPAKAVTASLVQRVCDISKTPLVCRMCCVIVKGESLLGQARYLSLVLV